jgi:hypothetical protein
MQRLHTGKKGAKMLKMLRALEIRFFGPPPDPAVRPTAPITRYAGFDAALSDAGVTRAAARATRIRRAHAYTATDPNVVAFELLELRARGSSRRDD